MSRAEAPTREVASPRCVIAAPAVPERPCRVIELGGPGVAHLARMLGKGGLAREGRSPVITDTTRMRPNPANGLGSAWSDLGADVAVIVRTRDFERWVLAEKGASWIRPTYGGSTRSSSASGTTQATVDCLAAIDASHRFSIERLRRG